ncbi:MAG TPA: DUF2946 domain-containing protein [Pseudolabrys sp.]|nr:DUF2946 domain-containing protein [Pseudolabrys sp.]
MALLALVLQLVLSFGHIHLTSAAPAQLALSSAAAGTPSAPTDQSGAGDDYCPICALVQLASISAPPAPPVLPLPATIDLVRLEAVAHFTVATSPHVAFQARGPPSA